MTLLILNVTVILKVKFNSKFKAYPLNSMLKVNVLLTFLFQWFPLIILIEAALCVVLRDNDFISFYLYPNHLNLSNEGCEHSIYNQILFDMIQYVNINDC